MIDDGKARGPRPAGITTAGPEPLVEELTPCPEVADALRALADLPDVLLLESALCRDQVGRYSFLTADPFAFFESSQVEFGKDPFSAVEDRLAVCSANQIAGLPPFQGGAAGLLSYELGHAWERLSPAPCDEFRLPALAVGLYDWVIAWDHLFRRAWIISHGFPETDEARKTDRAAVRLQFVRRLLQSGCASTPNAGGWGRRAPTAGWSGAPRLHRTGGFAAKTSLRPRPPANFARQWPAPGPEGLTSNFSREDYLRSVERVIEYIYAGDIFQANLSQRLLYRQQVEPLELYERLRRCNPAPFAGYFSHDDWAVVSASPERFVSVRDGDVETRPIKGTRQRRSVPEADLFSRDELRESDKDHAENVMIVDLLRNDLSRVCRPGSIRVPHLCSVETYETVQHLVSEIRGRLTNDRDVWDLFRAVFPGGSITGAPKVRAMEIIAELEPTARGPYSGSLFYAGFDGTVDSSILIRTFTCRKGWIQCQVGGGIVAQSDPVAEYEETLHKAEGMLRALE
jgi:para-aminobenzoate synthetase component 1